MNLFNKGTEPVSSSSGSFRSNQLFCVQSKSALLFSKIIISEKKASFPSRLLDQLEYKRLIILRFARKKIDSEKKSLKLCTAYKLKTASDKLDTKNTDLSHCHSGLLVFEVGKMQFLDYYGPRALEHDICQMF